MPHSHHSHSGQYCRHAKDTLELVILEAIRQGFTTYGLSEHAPRYRVEDLFPEEADLTVKDLGDTFQDFLTEAEHLQSKYADQISLLVGLETDYITSVDLERTTDLLDQHETIQYIVGSVHHVQGVSIDFDRNTWLRSVWHANADTTSTTMTLNPDTKLPSPTPSDNSNSRLVEGYIPSLLELRAFLMKYFDAQYDMLQSLRPEVVGHFDLCLLWTPEVCLVSDGMEEVWERVVRNVDFVIGYGGLFEANAAALRKGWRTCYPGQDILKLIIGKGGRVCLSDDSHGVTYVGLNYIKMRDYLLSVGVIEIYHLVGATERRKDDRVVGMRGRVLARRIGEEWAEDAFWRTLPVKQVPS